MKIGVSLPSTAIGPAPQDQLAFAQAAEQMGYEHLAVYDHVVGANPASREDWQGPYTSENPFHDPFVLMAFLAAQTEKIELTPQVLILAQRQTALVARQAASVDLLSGGRLRLGVGIGWNEVEFTTLGEDFSNRGVRSLEQIRVLKMLWSQDHVDFHGEWHTIPDVGLNPMPLQCPIPVWLGGSHKNVIRRIASDGDGWMPLAYQPDERGQGAIARLHRMIVEEGRKPEDVGIDAWVSMGSGGPHDWRAEVSAWRELGATHVTLNTAFDRLHHVPIPEKDLAAHIDAAKHYHDAVAGVLD